MLLGDKWPYLRKDKRPGYAFVFTWVWVQFALSSPEREELWRRGATALLFFGRFSFLLETTLGPQSRFPCPAGGRAVAALPRCCFESSLHRSRAHFCLRGPSRGFSHLDTSRLPPGITVCLPFPAYSSTGSVPARDQLSGGFVQPLFRPSPGSQGIGAAWPRARSGAPPAAAGEPSHLPCSPGAASAPCRLRAELHPRGNSLTAKRAGTGFVFAVTAISYCCFV